MHSKSLLGTGALGLMLALGCAATQAENVKAPAKSTAPIAPMTAPVADATTPVAKSDATTPITPADAAVDPEFVDANGRALTLLEIFPVQPVTPTRQNSASGGKAPANAGGNVVLTEPPGAAILAEKAAAGEVWVNAKSGAYHKPGTQYYGKTKQGFFLPEADAIAQGYRGVQGQ